MDGRGVLPCDRSVREPIRQPQRGQALREAQFKTAQRTRPRQGNDNLSAAEKETK